MGTTPVCCRVVFLKESSKGIRIRTGSDNGFSYVTFCATKTVALIKGKK